LYVVIWEPKHGAGGGHQLVADAARAETIKRQVGKARPECLIRIESAYDYGAQAVRERRGRRH
jgi:hypothetical protein